MSLAWRTTLSRGLKSFADQAVGVSRAAGRVLVRDEALVLFSGGQDSTTCLAWALTHFARVETVGFRYGQRHAVEMDCRPVIIAELRRRFPMWERKLGDDHVLDLDVIRSLGATAMTHDVAIGMTESGLPNTFVPGRNLLFFTAAAALAYRR